MDYSSPGNVDDLSDDLKTKWNETIKKSYNDRSDRLKSRFFSLDPDVIINPIYAQVQWFGDPAEPTFCLDESWGRKLSDWGIKGRHKLHNEYCEYNIKYQFDKNGKWRPKSVHFSTELREYWVMLAKYDPEKLKEVASEILGKEVTYKELYGTNDPLSLDERKREIRFSKLVAGHGADKELPPEVPPQPVGSINRENILFMTHPINGLDDLLYIVMFGAHPYATTINGARFPATKEQIFRSDKVEQLACRHADPAAAISAHNAAYNGRTVAFQDPLGMYIRTFNSSDIIFEGNELPEDWIKFSRGPGFGTYQRLEIGAPNDEDIFLDDFFVVTGSAVDRLTGGYQIAKKVEVGPLVIASETSDVADSEYKDLTASDDLIDCAKAKVCREVILPMKKDYENENNIKAFLRR